LTAIHSASTVPLQSTDISWSHR